MIIPSATGSILSISTATGVAVYYKYKRWWPGCRLNVVVTTSCCCCSCYCRCSSCCLGVWRPTALDSRCRVWNTHTHTHNRLTPFCPGTTRVSRYQKKHSSTHTHPDNRTSFIIFLHLQPSMASNLFSLRAWQSSQTTSLQVLFGLPLGLGPSTSYSMHFFTQSSSSFAAHAHTNAACSAAISMLCHLHLVSLSAPYLGVYLLT